MIDFCPRGSWRRSRSTQGYIRSILPKRCLLEYSNNIKLPHYPSFKVSCMPSNFPRTASRALDHLPFHAALHSLIRFSSPLLLESPQQIVLLVRFPTKELF